MSVTFLTNEDEKKFVNTVNGTAPDENGNVEIEIPEGFIGSWNDFPDKPFGEIIEGEVILEETEVTTIEGIGGYGFVALALQKPLVEGEQYAVTFDGIDYFCIVQGFRIGNKSITFYDAADTFEPFLYDGGQLFTKTPGKHTVSIAHIIGIGIKTLDEKYIPDTIARVADVPKTAEDVDALPMAGGTLTAKKSDVLAINNTANTNAYYVVKINNANRATFGFVRNFACVSNEMSGGARIGVDENGVPQFRTTSNESTAQTLIHTGNAEEKLGLTYTDSPLPFADIKCGSPVDNSMWLCDHTYQKGYVKHIKTRLMQGTGVTVNAGIVKASDMTLLRKYSVTADMGEVIIPVDEYIGCDFYVALAGVGLDFVGGKYSVYPFRYVSGSATTYLTSVNEGDYIGRTFGEFTDTKTTYVIAQEVEYNGRYNTSAPYTYTRNKMFAAGDSITAGYYSLDGKGYAVDASNKWWSIVGRTLGYKAAKVASTGSGFAFLKNETNACTLIEDVNFKSYDVAVFAFGTNDYGQNTPIGTIDDAYTSATDTSLTFYAAVKHVVEKVLTSNPTCALIFALPINRCDKGTIASNWAFGTANAVGHTLSDYCDAIINVCNKYGIPYIDRRNSIFNAYSLETLLIDKVHPSEEGYKLLGMELSARIGALIRPYAEYSGGTA